MVRLKSPTPTMSLREEFANFSSIVSWCLYKHMSDQNVWREEYRFFISFLGYKQLFSLWMRDGLNWRYAAWRYCGKGSFLEKEETERKDFVCHGVGRFQIDGRLNWDCISCHKFISNSDLNQRSREGEWVSGSRVRWWVVLTCQTILMTIQLNW